MIDRSFPFAEAYGSSIISRAATLTLRSSLEETFNELGTQLRIRGFNPAIIGSHSLQAVLAYRPHALDRMRRGLSSMQPGLYGLWSTKIELTVSTTPIEETPFMLSIFDWADQKPCIAYRPVTIVGLLQAVDDFLAGIDGAYQMIESTTPTKPTNDSSST